MTHEMEEMTDAAGQSSVIRELFAACAQLSSGRATERWCEHRQAEREGVCVFVCVCVCVCVCLCVCVCAVFVSVCDRERARRKMFQA
jgi:hypothetical protein